MLAYDEARRRNGPQRVTAVIVHDDPGVVALTLGGERLTTTVAHPFYTKERGWVEAGQLKAGDHVRTASGWWGTVQDVALHPTPRRMYNLTVEQAHTFFVGNGRWLVHNICFKPGSKGGPGEGLPFGDDVRTGLLKEDPTRTCVFCGRPGATHMDHVIPRSRGGNNTLENAQWGCEHCNTSKGNRTYPLNPPPGYKGTWPPDWWPWPIVIPKGKKWR